jgi:signal transduction histidine kinase
MVVKSSFKWTKTHLSVNNFLKIGLLLLLALLCVTTTFSSNVILLVLRSEMVFSHLFYLPVALAGVWWGLRGVFVSVFVAATWMVAYFLAGSDVPPQEYFPQPIMFMLIGVTVGILREQNLRSERNLRNRVKELDCLFAISTLREQTDLPLPALLQATVKLIPPAWQYPDITGARVVLEGHTCQTDNFADTPWQQFADIMIQDKPVGRLEVCYLEDRPPAYEGPFLREERYLLNAIAERLGRTVAHERAVTALRKSEFTNRALVNAIPDIIWRIGRDGTLLDFKGAKNFNPAVPVEDFVGRHLTDVMPLDVARSALRYVEQAAHTGAPQIYEYQFPTNGDIHYFEARLVLSGADEVLAIVRDITERKAREALVEEERTRIARDLHDGLAQSLYFLGLKLDFIRKQVMRDPDGVVNELLTLKRITQSSIQDVRRTIFALRPVDLERLGFEPAMQQYTREFGEHMGLNVLLHVRGDTAKLSTALELAFFRLIQEGLNNIAKHAHAHTVWIDLDINPGGSGQLTIRDDGMGFELEALPTSGSGKMGLHQMRERVIKLGGSFRIESSADAGTLLCADIPL